MVQLADTGFTNPALRTREQDKPREIAPGLGAIERYITPYQPTSAGPLGSGPQQEVANLPAPVPAPSIGNAAAAAAANVAGTGDIATNVNRAQQQSSVGPIESGATGTALAPAPSVAPGTGLALSGDQRKGFVDAVFGAGAAQGDASYWYEPRSDDSDFIAAAMRGLQNPDQRRQIVDYLFDNGLATGDRNYWYQSRGAEDADLIATFAGSGAGAPTGGAGGSGQRDIDALRQERLEAALNALNAGFDVDEGTLQAQKKQLEALFASGNRTLDRQERDTTEAINEQSIERGLFRSGIRLEDLARGTAPFAEQRADLLGNIGPGGLQIQQILSSLGLLGQQRASAEAGARLDSRADELDLSQMLALLNAGLSG